MASASGWGRLPPDNSKGEMYVPAPTFISVIASATFPFDKNVEGFLASLPQGSFVLIMPFGTEFNMGVRYWCMENKVPYQLVQCASERLYYEPNDFLIAEMILRMCDEMFVFDTPVKNSMAPEFDNEHMKTYRHLAKRGAQWEKVSRIFKLNEKAVYLCPLALAVFAYVKRAKMPSLVIAGASTHLTSHANALLK